MKRDKHNKHKIHKVVAILLLIAMPLSTKAQVFMLDGDENYRAPEDPSVFINLPSDYGMGTDYYAPVGDGLLLLSVLGGVYLLRKKEKSNK